MIIKIFTTILITLLFTAVNFILLWKLTDNLKEANRPSHRKKRLYEEYMSAANFFKYTFYTLAAIEFLIFAFSSNLSIALIRIFIAILMPFIYFNTKETFFQI